MHMSTPTDTTQALSMAKPNKFTDTIVIFDPVCETVRSVIPVLCYLSDLLSELPFGFRRERKRQTDIRKRKSEGAKDV